ncbi:MAG: alpha/beta hydrolase [Actinomycetota bacterium]|nr:alpha/beta hydrolase [Actinomycetota bacterium]
MNWETWKQRAVRFDVGATAVAGYDLGGGSATRTLTFCHGYPSSSLDIAPLAAILGSDWRVLTIDFPGFGASSPASNYSIHAAADAVEAWWTACSVGDTLLVAHDYGVSVAQELLARRADHQLDVAVSGVVWMNGGLYPDLHRPTLGQQLLLDPEHGAEFAASITEESFADAIRATWGQRRPANDAELHDMFAALADGDGVPRMHELLHYIADRREHEARWRVALEQCDLPMTFVWGDLDPVSGAHMIDRVEQRIPTADIRRLVDVGHWPPLEAPVDVASAIGSMP